MTKITSLLVVAVLFVASCALAQQGNIQPADDESQPAAQAALAATPAASATPKWQTREGVEEVARRAYNGEFDQKEGKPGRTIIVRRSMSVTQLRVIAEQGGPASAWANAAVADCLARGAKNGGVDGRTKGAKPTDSEWRRYVHRDEFAAGLERNAVHTETVVSNHNWSKDAHPDIRKDINDQGGLITGLQKQLGWIKWALVGLLLVAIGGYFFPQIRRGNVPPAPTY